MQIMILEVLLMKFFLIILLFFCLSLTGCNRKNSGLTKEQNNNYSVSRTTTADDLTNINNTVNADNNIETTNTETEISSFSTKIYTPDDESRQTNIRITCSKLDGTVIKSRRNFFFL